MSVSGKALEKRLVKAGKDLLDPPTSSSLVDLLNELFSYLSDVHKGPPSSMMNALTLLKKALVAPRLFEHTNVEVKVVVAACLSQIIRITAPHAPFNDDKMKAVLQLIVSSFEHLYAVDSSYYVKMISILEVVSIIRISIVMLDLECDVLLTEMFQHFLKSLRDDHPVTVFFSMENIMTVVLEESENISPELLSPILDYVKKDDKIPKVSKRLAEHVLTKCANKLKTYLPEAVKASDVSLDKYSDVVASICEGTFNIVVAHPNEAAGTHKRVYDEMETTITAEGEHSSRNAEPERKKLTKPCSVTDQLSKVKQSDTIF